jgi:hypothetical protein
VKSTLKVKQREKEVEKNVVGLVKVTSDGSIYDVSSFHSSTESADRLRTRSGPGTGTGTQKRRSSTAGALSTSTSSTSSSIHTLKDLGLGAAFCPGVREDESGEGLIEKHRDLERHRDKEKGIEAEEPGPGLGPGGKKTVVPTRQTVKRASTRTQQDAKRKADMAIRSRR